MAIGRHSERSCATPGPSTSVRRNCWALRPLHANIHRPKDSGRALARLVLDPALESVSGRYFEGLRAMRSSAESYDVGKAAALWDQSAELVGLG
jgi:hypothetical protein